MATAILAILCCALVVIAGKGWWVAWNLSLAAGSLERTAKGLDERCDRLVAERDELLRQKALWGRVKEDPFDRDAKIPDSKPGRYVPVAKRRAEAEAASLGPQTHSERVVANNARAIEQA
jgi:hypothetical protein